MSYEIVHAKIEDFCANYQGPLFHAILCDPPYHLTSITKRFGKDDSAPAQYGTDGAFGRLSKGFMGTVWDGGSTAFQPETWSALSKLLYPGGFIIAFGGTRTYHRMAVAMEDAGLILHPSIFFWGYGQGFPKATRVKGHPEFDGHRYGAQALKPGGEILLVAKKQSVRIDFIKAVVEAEFCMEVCLWQYLNALDVEKITNQTRQILHQVADSFALGFADLSALLDVAMSAEKNTESSRAIVTLLNFVAGRVSNKEEMLQLEKIIQTGKVEGFSEVTDTSCSVLAEKKFLSIATLWRTFLEEVLVTTSKFTTETETNLTTELRILKSFLFQITSKSITQVASSQTSGLNCNATNVENILMRMIIALRSLNTISVADNATEITVDCMEDLAEKNKKPLIEPIIVAQKPYEGRPIDNITQTGAGALNIDAARIAVNPAVDDQRLGGNGKFKTDKSAKNVYEGGYAGIDIASHIAGRWPPNVVLSHTPDCRKVGQQTVPGYTINQFTDGAKPFGDGAGHPYQSTQMPDETVDVWACVEGCPIRTLNKQSGTLTSGTGAVKRATGAGHQGNVYGADSRPAGTPNLEYGDTGGAARFFPNFDWNAEAEERLALADTFFYQAKASKSERDAGLDGLPETRVSYMNTHGGDASKGDEWEPLDERTGETRNRFASTKNNFHPSVKPIALATWLAKLLLPPDRYAPRRILVPFSGSGSEMIGCVRAGWEEVVGVEMTDEYIPIAEARLAYWSKRQLELPMVIKTTPQTQAPAPEPETDDNQLTLFG